MNFLVKTINQILKAYELLFFLLFNHYKFEKDKFGRAYFITFLITAFESINVYTILIFLKLKNNINFDSKLLSLIIFIIISVFNVYIFVVNNKFIDSNKNFEKIRYKSRNVFFLVWLYYILSFIAVSYIILLDSVNGRFDLIEQYFRNIRL